ncbi:MAG: hypothetical protein MUE85_01800 [Microscillaceae bacterium]|jgi:hypothetical protein|nr:hypothetical protein [Microscillaceae bacterium]
MTDILFTQPDWQLFTNINTLPQQAGVSKHWLPKLIAKELTDNALDTGAKVEISHYSPEVLQDIITVRDFGRGIAGTDAEIADLFSLKRPLTSSKRLRLPMRGALGNGLRVVVATVYCLGGELTVATRGRKLKIIPQDDGSSRTEFLGEFIGEGTEIQVLIPDNFLGESLLDWAHLALQINQGEIYSGKTNPYWYDSDSFYNLLLTIPENVDLATFLYLFDKVKKSLPLAPSEGEGTITSSPPLAEGARGRLNRSQADDLLATLRKFTKPLAPKKLGAIGKLNNFQAYHIDYQIFTIKTTKGTLDAEIPAVIEAYATTAERSDCQFFVNRTPITGEVGMSLLDKKIWLYGCGLNQNLETAKLKNPLRLWLNITTPYMPIVSNGKEPDLSILAEAIGKTIQKAIQQLKKQENQDSNEVSSPVLDKSPSQKQVVIDNLDTAIDKASGNGQYRFSLRQLYYVMRPLVMENTGKELKYANFNQIITDYEFEIGRDLRGVYRDERGTLLHPHTHEEIKLGTKNVEKYTRPIFSFNKILYSEKEGFFEILKDAGFCERHDCALLTSKGFASRAARDVIDLLAETEEELLFFCIHDADISGTLIYQALQGATKARPGRKVQIINLGIEPWEGLAMNLEVESLEKRSTKTPAQYVIDFENDWQNPKPMQFEKYTRWADWTEWLRSFRIELNAMDTPTFVSWLDNKVRQYDNGKVIPNELFLKQEAELSLEANLRQKIREDILKNLNIEQLIENQFVNSFPELKKQLEKLELQTDVAQDLQQNLRQSWRDSFWKVIKDLGG